MTAEENARSDDSIRSEIGEIGNRVRYIQRKIVEIGKQVEESYHLLRDALDSPTRGDDTCWYDNYQSVSEYDH